MDKIFVGVLDTWENEMDILMFIWENYIEKLFFACNKDEENVHGNIFCLVGYAMTFICYE